MTSRQKQGTINFKNIMIQKYDFCKSKLFKIRTSKDKKSFEKIWLHQQIWADFEPCTDRNFVDNFLKVVINLALVANI